MRSTARERRGKLDLDLGREPARIGPLAGAHTEVETVQRERAGHGETPAGGLQLERHLHFAASAFDLERTARDEHPAARLDGFAREFQAGKRGDIEKLALFQRRVDLRQVGFDRGRLEPHVDAHDPLALQTHRAAEAAEATAKRRAGPLHFEADAAGAGIDRIAVLRIESVALAGPPWNPTVTARVTLRDATRDVRFVAAVFARDDTLTVIANFRIRQSEFGIKPFAALNSGLLVGDAIDLRVRVVARRE